MNNWLFDPIFGRQIYIPTKNSHEQSSMNFEATCLHKLRSPSSSTDNNTRVQYTADDVQLTLQSQYLSNKQVWLLL